MATDLGKAYVQIVPSAKGIGSSISQELSGESISAGKTAGNNIVGTIKSVIAAAGIGKAIKSTLEAGGNLQQSFGGLDTLYGKAADAAKAYAVEAAAAGISANDYAEQAVSFGAALKQAFDNDVTKAAEAANTAILDMADNSAKMGTDITAIQTAYQGFAKQNYTMLDNLKLGYGGTRSEMERLLADASNLEGAMGKTFDINNLGDVYEAIHLVQEDLGLTGVAAAEAKETFSGSLGAMKAAGENLLANLALGEDIRPALDTLSETVRAFIFGNLVPMLTNIVTAMPDLISGLSSILIQGLNIVANNSDEIISQGVEIVTSLVSAIIEAAPYLVEAALNLAMSLGEALINTDWLTIGNNLINSIKDSLSLAAGEILGTDDSLIKGIMDGITSFLPGLLDSGISIISEIQNGILSNLPELITTAGDLINQFAAFVLENGPTILESGMNMLLTLCQGIMDNLPAIVSSVIEVTAKFISTLAEHLPEILQQGIVMLGQLASGLIQALPQLVTAILQIIKTFVGEFSKYDWLSIGKNILIGIKNGILGAITDVVNAAKEAASSIWDAVTGFFGINSPSTLGEWGGEMIDAGVAGGITKNVGLVDDAIDTLGKSATAELQFANNYGELSTSNQTDSKYNTLLNLLGEYLPQIAEGMNTRIALEGDAEGLFNVIKNQNKVYKKMNGESAFA